MKKILITLALVASAAAQSVSISGTASVGGSVSASQAAGGGGGGSCGGSYDVAIPLVLNKALSVDLADFAYPQWVKYKALATTAHSGKVHNTVSDFRGRTRPADVHLCTAQSGGSPLKFYMPEWNDTTGEALIILLAAPLHAATNDVVWLLIGNASITADPYDYSLITDANLADWCHGESFNCDVNNGTASGSSPTANVAGRVGGALSLTQANGDYVTLNHPAWPGGNNITVMGLLNTAGGGFMRILSNLNNSGNNGWLFSLTNANGPMLYEDSGGTVHQYQTPCCIAASTWFSQAFTSDGTTIKGYLDGDLVGTGTGGAIGTPTQNMLIGNNADGTGVKWNGLLDELVWAASTWAGDKVDTMNEIFRGAGYSAIYDVTGSDPAIRQSKACDSKTTSTSDVCKFETKLTPASNHFVVVASAQEDSSSCSTTPSSSCGLTYTRVGTPGHFTGTIHSYYSCAYTAPITSACAETLTFAAGNVSSVMYEVWNVTDSGLTTTNAGNTAGPPAVMTATCGGTKCFALCTTKGNTASTPTSNAEGYDGIMAPAQLNIDHPAQTYAATGVVNSGSRSCTLSGTFTDTGTFVLMPVN